VLRSPVPNHPTTGLSTTCRGARPPQRTDNTTMAATPTPIHVLSVPAEGPSSSAAGRAGEEVGAGDGVALAVAKAVTLTTAPSRVLPTMFTELALRTYVPGPHTTGAARSVHAPSMHRQGQARAYKHTREGLECYRGWASTTGTSTPLARVPSRLESSSPCCSAEYSPARISLLMGCTAASEEEGPWEVELDDPISARVTSTSTRTQPVAPTEHADMDWTKKVRGAPRASSASSLVARIHAHREENA
jgi:hypothetical protein